MHKSRFILVIALLITLPLLRSGSAQAAPLPQVEELVSLTVQDAGYDRVFRPEHWMPILIRARNNGDPITGSIVVRPDTSGSGVLNAFSTPITLDNGADQQIMLYVVPRPFAQTLQVELLDEAGERVTARSVSVRPIALEDHLYVVITDAVSGIVNMTGAISSGRIGYQANWTVENLPDYAGALEAVDVILFTDADTNTLSRAQQDALTDWVIGGGHLIVAGGGEPGALDTAAGLRDLLPFEPGGSITVDDVTPLAQWAGKPNETLIEQTVITTGSVRDEARTLVALDDDTPLLVRWTLGGGTVDYLTANPQTGALRDWDSIGDFFLMLLTTPDPTPSWGNGLLEWRLGDAVSASQILPGTTVLPDVLALCGFLGLYIALVGPVNYLILNRINRREWAWVTIPLFIMLFSVLAWVVGFNLRGNEAIVGRVTLVQAWHDSERAHAEQLVGLLSPRRSTYSISMAGETAPPLLHPITGDIFSTPLGGSGRAQANIVQTDRFRATDFAVDASIIATFDVRATIAAPPISGQVTLLLGETDLEQSLRGSVRNDGDFTLIDPVILARNTALPLTAPLEPGAVVPFETQLFAQTIPAPSALEHATANSTQFISGGFTGGGAFVTLTFPEETIRHLLGPLRYDLSLESPFSFEEDTLDRQDARRRRLFLNAFVADSYYSTARGNSVYLAGWAESSPLTVELEGANFRENNLTLYIIELDTTVSPASGTTLISADQFTWLAEERGLSGTNASPFDISLFQEDELIFRFTPLGSAQLAEVDELILTIDQGQSARSDVDLEVWNWETEAWEVVRLRQSEAVLANPDGYIGPNNAVRVRVAQEVAGGLLQLASLQVAQRGRF